jgi:hypothetical protein
MSKLRALWAVFHKGSMVANPQAWKERQITVTALAGALMAIVHLLEAFGYAIPVSPDDVAAIAAGLLTVVNVVLTIVTTEKVGLPPVAGDRPEDPTPRGARNAQPDQDERYLG